MASITSARTIREITAGLNHELGQFGVQIGGHTIIGPRTEIGLTVMGQRDSESDIGNIAFRRETIFLQNRGNRPMAAQMRANVMQKTMRLCFYMLAPSKPLGLLKQLGITRSRISWLRSRGPSY